MIKNILVCLEGSPGTERAIELARAHGARLVGLAIADETDARAGIDERLAQLEERGQAAGVAIDTLELHRRPAARILAEIPK